MASTVNLPLSYVTNQLIPTSTCITPTSTSSTTTHTNIPTTGIHSWAAIPSPCDIVGTLGGL